MDKIKYETEDLLPIVTKLAARYTGFEHSSVTYEKAQQLMGAVLYCIHECEKYSKTAVMKREGTAREAYEIGKGIVEEKVKKLRRMYNQMIPGFCSYGMECLQDTIVKGIPEFLVHYDMEFAPQDTILTLDYPVLKRIQVSTGVDAVLKYVQCICYEQKFLGLFEKSHVIRVLKAYHSEYEVLLENICQILLPNLTGHMLLHHTVTTEGFTKEDYDSIEELLLEKNIKQLAEYQNQMLCQITDQYFEGSRGMCDYLQSAVTETTKSIYRNLQNNCLERIFLL